jgi:hypothetical protein
MVREVGRLIAGAVAARQQLATFAVDGEIAFASAASRAAFAEELGAEVARLAAKYHDAAAPGARRHRLVVALHPSLKEDSGGAETAPEESAEKPVEKPAEKEVQP